VDYVYALFTASGYLIANGYPWLWHNHPKDFGRFFFLATNGLPNKLLVDLIESALLDERKM
jgi:hypothetical protein